MSSTRTTAPLPHRFPFTMAQAPAMTKPKTMKIKMAVPSPTKLPDPESETIESFSAPIASRTMRNMPKQITAMDCTVAMPAPISTDCGALSGAAAGAADLSRCCLFTWRLFCLDTNPQSTNAARIFFCATHGGASMLPAVARGQGDELGDLTVSSSPHSPHSTYSCSSQRFSQDSLKFDFGIYGPHTAPIYVMLTTI